MAASFEDNNAANGEHGASLGQPLSDSLVFVIALSAIVLFVGTGGAVMTDILGAKAGAGIGPDRILVCALLLNIAVILFGWSRYRQLTGEVRVRRIAEADARVLAGTDPLTGFLNRRSLIASAEDLLRQSAARGETVAFLMLDLDNFKTINDLHGHVAGDGILGSCAGRVAALLPDRSIRARIGGDEFACLVPFDRDQPERVDELAEALIKAVAAPIVANGNEIEVTVSIGVARADRVPGGTGRETTQALMHAADIAMYHAKKHGRNRCFWFEAPMESELRARRELETGIRRGIPLGEFVPYYEQQVDLKTGRLVGFEMLARWNSPLTASSARKCSSPWPKRSA